jgi:PAS domain S-box-containing protein
LNKVNDSKQRKKLNRTFLDKEKHYQDLLHFIPDIVYRIDTHGKFEFLNKSIFMLGYKPEELIGKHFSIIIYHEDITRLTRALSDVSSLKRVLVNESISWVHQIENLEVRLVSKQLRSKHILNKNKELSSCYGEINASAYYNLDAATHTVKLSWIVGTIREVINREKSERYLRKMFGAVDQSPISIVIADKNGTIEYINPEFIRVRGYLPQEVIGKKVNILKSKYHPEEFYLQIKNALAAEGEWRGEILNRKRNGKLFWESVTISSVRDPSGEISNFISIQEDITEKKQTQEQLKVLKEKEILLREIHHRVKNNLQIISSLMNLQLHSIPDAKTIEIFKQCESRIKAMALIHEKLYQSEDIERIDFEEYLKSFIFHIVHSHQLDNNKIKIKLRVDQILLNIDIAIPCGLILNELISNALKHAFSETDEGVINITVQSTEDDYILLVSDNGKGLPEDFALKKVNSLGLQLVEMLVKQLNGKMETSSGGKYTIFKITFPKEH